MFKTIILSLLVLYSIADNSVTLGCQMCQGRVCLTMKGGPFEGLKVPSKEKSCSQLQFSLPVTYSFECKSNCSDGCLLTVIEKWSSQSICTSNGVSQIILNELDMLYNLQMRDQTMQSKYDWCACSKQLPQQIPQQTSESNYLGVVILLMVIAAAGVGVFFLLKKKKEKQQQKRFPTSQAIMVLGNYNRQ